MKIITRQELRRLIALLRYVNSTDGDLHLLNEADPCVEATITCLVQRGCLIKLRSDSYVCGYATYQRVGRMLQREWWLLYQAYRSSHLSGRLDGGLLRTKMRQVAAQWLNIEAYKQILVYCGMANLPHTTAPTQE